jgi:ATP-grasp domain, R2K clade family 3
MKFLLQNVNTEEVRTIRQAAMMGDGIQVINASIGKVSTGDCNDAMHQGYTPVGSVEFLRECMKAMAIQEPEPISYPNELLCFLDRKFGMTTKGMIIGIQEPIFIKPVRTKLFTGFVYGSPEQPDPESLGEFASLSDSEPIWWSDVIQIQSEWRFYIDQKKIIGCARYDQHEWDTEPPDMDIVNQMIKTCSNQEPYALDVAIMDNKKTVLMEVNDFWAIGLYDKCIRPMEYAKMLNRRWKKIVG